jgi:hypothetical protein
MHPLRQLNEARGPLRDVIVQHGLGVRQVGAGMQNDGNVARVPMRSKMSA